jgi:hypothetical protein
LQVWQRKTGFGKGEQNKPHLTENSMKYSPQASPAVSNFANPYRFGKGEQTKPHLTENSMKYSPQASPAVLTLPILAGLAKEN